jgi:hypothetical protein
VAEQFTADGVYGYRSSEWWRMRSTHWACLLPNMGRSLYNNGMTTKEIALKTIEQLPEGVSWEEIQERINFIVGVRKGLRELDEGKGIPHDKIKEEFSEWLSN